MVAAGINAVRTYEPITDRKVLDVLWSKGIHVLNTVYISGDADPNQVAGLVESLRDHPAILMWVIGNEWNYNMLYSGMPFDRALHRVQAVARVVKRADRSHPVATVFGMSPGPEVISALGDIDVWGLTAYTGISFGNLFDVWVSRSEKPMFLAEFGADAYDARHGRVDEADQAKATEALSAEILAHRAEKGGVCAGGFIFELADEWWKDGKGSSSTHDVGGIAPGGGPFPDNTFNEEYWGIVRNDGTPREAYRAYARVIVPDRNSYANHSAGVSLSDITPGYRLRACGANPGCGDMLGDCCPTKEGSFRSCCSAAAQRSDAGTAPSLDSHRTSEEAGTSASHCKVHAPVPCCQDGDCGSCAGNQCCPGRSGSVTCPSASSALAEGCILPKLYDCTGKTGILPPTTTTLVPTTTTTAVGQSFGGFSWPWQWQPSRPATPEEGGGGGPSTTSSSDVVELHKPSLGSVSGTVPPISGTTPGAAITLMHTTMAQGPHPRLQSPGAWVLGEEKLSCDTVCAEAGGCVEGGWPTSEAAFQRIVSGLGYACFDMQSGGGKYDPSTQQGNCGWSWNGGQRQIWSHDFMATRCGARAPAFTRRFCPCRLIPPGQMHFSARRRLLGQEDREEGTATAELFA